MKLVNLARRVWEKSLVSGKSEVWIVKKDGSRPIKAIFLGLGATGDTLEQLVNDPNSLSPETEEGELAYYRSSPLLLEPKYLAIKEIASVDYVADVCLVYNRPIRYN